MEYEIQFVRLLASACMPVQAHPGDAGWDLFVSRPVIILPGEFQDVHTDIAVELPEGFFARIVGRSSTVRKHGLLVVEGIIDQGFRGELYSGVYNLGDEPFIVEQGTRLAQLIPTPLVSVRWTQVPSLQASSRGISGFGSSGL